MLRSSFAAVVILCSAIGACSGVDAREPATTYLDDIQAEASTFEQKLGEHRASVDGAASVAVLAAFEQAHLEDATTHLGSVGRDVEGMCQCTNDRGDTMAPDDMRALVDEAMDECARHHTAMGHLADLAAARAEEHHHHAVMSGMLARMKGACDQIMMGGGMMSGAGTYSCPGGR